LGASRLGAQDATVGDPVWLMVSPAPSGLGAVTQGLRPAYPESMGGTDQIGYAVIARFVSENGKDLELNIQATDPAFEKATRENRHSHDYLFQWDASGSLKYWKPRAAVVDGKPVDSFFWVPVIFNPASARADGPDATPRLLSVTPIFVSDSAVHGDFGTSTAHVRLEIDALGGVTRIAPLAPGTERYYWPTIEKAVATWRFAPARKGGLPLAAVLDMTVLPQAYHYFHTASRTDRLPEVVSTVLPEYPPLMRNLRVRAEVTVQMVVDVRGGVVNPVVLRSMNPGFNENAVLAVKRWKFKPGLHNGRPAPMSMALPLVFRLDGAYDTGTSAYSTGGDTAEAGPASSHPPRVLNVVDPVHPYELLREGIAGSATARMVVDKGGHVVHVDVLEASDSRFGDALAAALEDFLFDPARHEGQPAPARVTYGHEFKLRDAEDGPNGDALDAEKTRPRSIHDPRELDHALQPISRPAPIYPIDLRDTTSQGSATVEFLVNEKGEVCLPRVVAASAPQFGWSAVQAASAWLFEPPLVGGSAAIVRVRVPFKFRQNPGRGA
jgi:TonB family protein